MERVKKRLVIASRAHPADWQSFCALKPVMIESQQHLYALFHSHPRFAVPCGGFAGRVPDDHSAAPGERPVSRVANRDDSHMDSLALCCP